MPSQGEPLRSASAGQAVRRAAAEVVDPSEPQHPTHAERVHEGEKEGRAARVPGTVHASVEQAHPLPLRGSPLPGDVAPDAPVVVVIRLRVAHLDAATRRAGATRRRRGERRHHVPGEEVVLAKLHRREVAVGLRSHDEIELRPAHGRRARPRAGDTRRPADAPSCRRWRGPHGRCRMLTCGRGHLRAVAIVAAVGPAVRHQHPAAPAGSAIGQAHLAADQEGEVPPLVRAGHQVEVVPLAPGRVAGAREMEAVQVVVELLRRRRDVRGIGRRVGPASLAARRARRRARRRGWGSRRRPEPRSAGTRRSQGRGRAACPRSRARRCG